MDLAIDRRGLAVEAPALPGLAMQFRYSDLRSRSAQFRFRYCGHVGLMAHKGVVRDVLVDCKGVKISRSDDFRPCRNCTDDHTGQHPGCAC